MLHYIPYSFKIIINIFVIFNTVGIFEIILREREREREREKKKKRGRKERKIS